MDRDTVLQLLRYNRSAATFTWKRRPPEMFRSDGYCRDWNRRYAGKLAGHTRHITILGRGYLKSHLVWLLERGEPVPFQIDHKDGDWTNDRISNLRAATYSQNTANGKRRITNRCGVKGVCWDRGRYKAFINNQHIGRFKTLRAAAAARRKAAVLMHGEFARHE